MLAAASLTETFTVLAADFEDAHPGVQVDLALDSSATLAAQAAEGAPADVLATADLATMADAEDAGALADAATPFASNTLVLATPADNPAGIADFADLDGEVTYVVCAETAPCGAAAAAVLEEGGITHEPASLEVDVKAVLARLLSGEADAGLVFATDAVAAGDRVRVIDVPDADAHATTYPIGVLDQAAEPDLAREFVDLVLSAEGRAVLEAAGFAEPGA
ncbi:molybdate ABC transporter substrate-binding protein [Myroides odoratimimus subsp. xuanwuensis]